MALQLSGYIFLGIEVIEGRVDAVLTQKCLKFF